MLSNGPSPLAARISGRLLAAALVALSLVGGLLVLEAPHVASAEDPECEVTDLGALGGETQEIEATGRWTTEDCESAFRTGSDAHSYRFQVTEAGRVRIDLQSSEADSYLYLLSEAGDRVADDDDSAGGRNARIEQDLSPGAYRIEATTVGGRGRGLADFSLTISYVEGCETVDLGVLTAEADLTATGVWSLETCGSRIVETHPAYNYSFVLPVSGRVRIDLTSEYGDPVMSLASPTGVIGANDDGGPGRNSRIEEYLPAGVYLIEATTYLQSDRQPLVADFELTVHLVDEAAAQQTFILKMEETLVPDVVIAGEPFTVDFRVGNVGGGDLPEDWFAILYAIGPRAYVDLEVPASEAVWNAGASYHSSPELASATSTAIPSVEPIEVTLPRPGNSWIFIGVQPFQVIEDEGRYDNPSTHHGIWRTLRVVTAPIYGPVTVSVDGAGYTVEAADDEDGEVTTTVTSVADAAAEVADLATAKATYTAAVAETVLDGILERPGLEGLWAADRALEVDIANASSSTLLDIFAREYERLIADSDLDEPLARREAINPVDVEDFVLMVGDKAAGQYASLAASWSALEERVGGGEALSFAEAFAVQAELAYAERILAPVATAANVVRAAREAEAGWQDRGVVRMARGLALDASCGASGDERLERFSALDAEIRAALPVFGYGVDAALCGALLVDGANARFLARLAIESEELTALNAPVVPEVEPVEPPPPPPLQLRIIARLAEDGRVEHGVEFSNGFQILPTRRFLETDAGTNVWQITSDIEVFGTSIGLVRARRLWDGRIQLGFRDVNGVNITPDIRFLPADLPLGTWLRSSVIEAPRPE